MEIQAKDINTKAEEKKSEFPKILKYYSNSDFSLQQKARLFYYIIIAAIVALILLAISSSYVQISSSNGIFSYQILIPQIILLLIFLFCIWILIKGNFNLSTNLFMISANITVWYIMWISKGNIIVSIDTVVIILAIINTIPLFINRYKWFIFVYIILNLLILFLFVYSRKSYPGFTNSIHIDYLVDTAIAIIFSGIAVYQIVRLNNKALEKLESDYKFRIKTEQELSETESKYRTLFENAQIGIYQTTPEGKILQANPALIEMLGYDSFDDLSKRNTNHKSAYVNSNREQFVELIEKQGFVKDFESEWKKKNGEILVIRENSRLVKDTDGKTKYYDGFVENITERKIAERALKESEQKYRTLMESLNEIIIVADNNHVVEFVNKAFTEKLGYKPEEIVGKEGYKILHDPNDYHLIEKANLDRINQNLTHYEIPFIAKDGKRFVFLVSGAPILNSANETIGSVGAMIDITERKRAEKALEESEEKYRTLMENMNDVVMLVDNDDRVQYVNKRFCEKLGYNEQEIIGKIGYEVLLDPKDQEIIIKANNERTRDIISQYELTFTAKDGSKIDFLVSGSPIKNSEGKIIGSIGNLTDITERKKNLNALRESEKKYRNLMESMNEVVMMVDKDDRIQYVNNRFTEKMGYSSNEVLGEIGFNYLFDKKELDIIINATNNRGKSLVSQYELSFATKKGKKITFLVSAAPIANSDGETQGFILAMADITEKKIIEKELEKYRENLELLVQERTEELAAANEELTSINEELFHQREELESVLSNLKETQKQLVHSEKMASLGLLAAGVAHEINNPLNFIKGGIVGLESFIYDNFNGDMQDVAPLIEGINTGVDRAAAIVTSLNHYSRRDDLPASNCEVHSIIENCLVMIQNQIKNRIQIVKEYASESFSILCNEGKLHQAILNILSNAVQAIENEGTIVIKTELDDDKIKLTFKDDGCGISQENLSKVLDPFFTTKDPGKGTGLGLSITFNILQELDGTIEFESEINKGTNVIIKLPFNKQ